MVILHAFMGIIIFSKTTWIRLMICCHEKLNWNRFFIKINEVLQFLENWIGNANSILEYHFGSLFNWWGLKKLGCSIYFSCKWNFGKIYFYIWIFCEQMLRINCIQKCFVQISGGSRGYLVNLYMWNISSKDSYIVKCVLLKWIFIADTALKNFTSNSALSIWDPLLCE